MSRKDAPYPRDDILRDKLICSEYRQGNQIVQSAVFFRCFHIKIDPFIRFLISSGINKVILILMKGPIVSV